MGIARTVGVGGLVSPRARSILRTIRLGLRRWEHVDVEVEWETKCSVVAMGKWVSGNLVKAAVRTVWRVGVFLRVEMGKERRWPWTVFWPSELLNKVLAQDATRTQAQHKRQRAHSSHIGPSHFQTQHAYVPLEGTLLRFGMSMRSRNLCR
jgi:hypothetical protein